MAFASVVHVNEKGGSFGGTEEYIALLTSALSARGIRSHLVCGVVSGSLPGDLASIHVVAGLASRRARPGSAAAVAKVIAELDPDVIYVHNVFDPAAVSAIAAVEGRGVLLWYVHDDYLTCLSELRWRRDIAAVRIVSAATASPPSSPDTASCDTPTRPTSRSTSSDASR